jgi:hypothetical protein
MLTKENTTRLVRENYSYLTSEFGVERIGLFGSIAKGIETEDSDVDIIVEFRRPIGLKFIELVEYLENLFGRKVDVMTKDGLDNVRLKDIGDDIRRNVIYV